MLLDNFEWLMSILGFAMTDLELFFSNILNDQESLLLIRPYLCQVQTYHQYLQSLRKKKLPCLHPHLCLMMHLTGEGQNLAHQYVMIRKSTVLCYFEFVILCLSWRNVAEGGFQGSGKGFRLVCRRR